MQDFIHSENRSFLEAQPTRSSTKPSVTHVTHMDPYSELDVSREYRVDQAVYTLRLTGHLSACNHALSKQGAAILPEHDYRGLGFLEEERTCSVASRGFFQEETVPLEVFIHHFQSVYAQRMGIQYKGFVSEEIASWIEEYFEKPGHLLHIGQKEKQAILQLLMQAELFERCLGTRYVGQKRFSLEGAETLIPMLVFLLDHLAVHGANTAILGMTHRGRMNVFAHVMKKPLEHIFAEFEGRCLVDIDAGDVKYHKGFQNKIITNSGLQLLVVTPSNPSHLESVDSVIEGISRGVQEVEHDTKRELVVPVLLHGDAAASGQGVIYETLQLSRLPGYCVGGTVHIIINNHIGFTTSSDQARSTQYCSDIAKAFGFPIFHVDAEDPEGCVQAILAAAEIRQKFHIDVFVELNCYRKYGHNENDEPFFTQPIMYTHLRKRRSIASLYAEQCANTAFVSTVEKEYTAQLQKSLGEAKSCLGVSSQKSASQKKALPFVTLQTLQTVSEVVHQVPKGFSLHPRLQKLVDERRSCMNDKDYTQQLVDWSFAETLAFASIVSDGTAIRLSGQDTGRGTFSHRHGIWVDQKTQLEYVPLAHVGSSVFEIINSPLSEYGALGFEYGYSISGSQTLVIWEAQFGDFVNVAQVVIDQYIASGKKKWGVTSNLTLLLPHGYEGEGPEHSSARIERFLLLCAEENMTLSVPTTPAQYFHLLRKQVMSTRPLVVFTPKGLLRYPECISLFSDFEGEFKEIIIDKTQEPAKRVIFCQGKVFYTIRNILKKQKDTETILIRLEQLYPFPEESLKLHIPNVDRYLFVQEEPENGGAYWFLKDRLQMVIPYGKKLKCIARRESASPAIGSREIHEQELEELFAHIREE